MSYLFNFEQKIRDNRQMQALTGLSTDEFNVLVKKFQETYKKLKSDEYKKRKKINPNARMVGGGRKGKLDS